MTSVLSAVERFGETIRPTLARYSVLLLRTALGLIFAWFGGLKVAGTTPVGELVANTVPFVPADLLVPALGWFEVGVGVLLISGRLVGWAVAAMLAQLAGTFLVFVVQPETAFQGGNPLLITMEGEFVAKNIVLIGAGLVVAAYAGRGARDRAGRTGQAG